jgi:hypothetical protein
VPKILILCSLLVPLSGCASGGLNKAPRSGAELPGAAFLRDSIYEATTPNRDRPPDYGQPIYTP